jgi:hypothetical protein
MRNATLPDQGINGKAAAIAELLVARRWAERLRQPDWRCTRSVKLRSVNIGPPYLYVLPEGQILQGATKATSRPVDETTCRHMLGES